MKNYTIVYVFVFILIFGCDHLVKYQVNSKTTEIGYIKPINLEGYLVDSIIANYRVPGDYDSSWHEVYHEMMDMPLKTTALFFKDAPTELIGVDFPNQTIRYVFNPNLSSEILSGISPQLDSLEKVRIVKRVEKIFLSNPRANPTELHKKDFDISK